MGELPRAEIKGVYREPTIRTRIEAFFLDNIGKVATRQQIITVATDPRLEKEPENWHQRLSELRTDLGYTILTARDRADLKLGEYMMPSPKRRTRASQRVRPSAAAWLDVLRRAGNRCEWAEEGRKCELRDGDIDPIGGGTVRLTPDHKRPHSVDPDADPNDPSAWQALCGRHQVTKKNYWDHSTGKLNVYAIVQAASEKVKREIYDFLRRYFDDV
jgi:hypothetical protein